MRQNKISNKNWRLNYFLEPVPDNVTKDNFVTPLDCASAIISAILPYACLIDRPLYRDSTDSLTPQVYWNGTNAHSLPLTILIFLPKRLAFLRSCPRSTTSNGDTDIEGTSWSTWSKPPNTLNNPSKVDKRISSPASALTIEPTATPAFSAIWSRHIVL